MMAWPERPTPNLCGPLPGAYIILPGPSFRSSLPNLLFKTRLRSPGRESQRTKPPHGRTAPPRRRQEDKNRGTKAPTPLQEKGRLRAPAAPPGGAHEGALLTPSDNLRAAGRRSGGRERASRPSPTISAARRRAPPTFRAYFSGLASIPALPVSALRAIWMFLGPASLFFLSFFLALGFIRTRHMFLISVMRLDEILVRVMNCSFGRAFLVFGGQFELRTLLMEVSWFVST